MEYNASTILPEPTLRRLPWYLAYVEMLRAKGEATVSSTRMSTALSVDASQIAKDLSFLNIKGKTRIGYDVNRLAETLSEFLGFRTPHRAVIVGVGSLGSALINDTGLANYGLKIVAGYDTDPALSGRSLCGVPIHSMDDLEHTLPDTKARIGILTLPAEHAQQCADRLMDAGVKALWNFTPYRIRVRQGVALANTSIYAHLALIYNRLAVTEHH